MADDTRLEALREMLAEDPDDAFTRYALAMEYRSLDRPADALSEFAIVARNAPDYVATYYQYGRLLADQGLDDKALEIVRRGVDVAKAQGDRHALSELEELLEELTA